MQPDFDSHSHSLGISPRLLVPLLCMVFRIPFKRRHFDHFFRLTIQRCAAKLRKKKLISRYLESGRENDSLDCFKRAIELGCKTAPAEIALICMNQRSTISYPICLEALQLVTEGHLLGYSDCTGMLAYIKTIGLGKSSIGKDWSSISYRLACASADAGSLFGYMAVIHFLRKVVNERSDDPDVDHFDIRYFDNFIKDFFPNLPESSQQEDDYYDYELDNLSDKEIQDIINILVNLLKQKYADNPRMVKVYCNLPSCC